MATECVTFYKRATVSTVRGKVRNQLDEPIVDAAILLTSESDGSKSETKSDKQGTFHFRSLRKGKYTIQISARDFASARRQLLVADCRDVKCGKRLEVRLTVGIGCPSVEVKGFDNLAELERDIQEQREQRRKH